MPASAIRVANFPSPLRGGARGGGQAVRTGRSRGTPRPPPPTPPRKGEGSRAACSSNATRGRPSPRTQPLMVRSAGGASRTTRAPGGPIAGPPRGSRRSFGPPHHEATVRHSPLHCRPIQPYKVSLPETPHVRLDQLRFRGPPPGMAAADRGQRRPQARRGRGGAAALLPRRPRLVPLGRRAVAARSDGRGGASAISRAGSVLDLPGGPKGWSLVSMFGRR